MRDVRVLIGGEKTNFQKNAGDKIYAVAKYGTDKASQSFASSEMAKLIVMP